MFPRAVCHVLVTSHAFMHVCGWSGPAGVRVSAPWAHCMEHMPAAPSPEPLTLYSTHPDFSSQRCHCTCCCSPGPLPCAAANSRAILPFFSLRPRVSPFPPSVETVLIGSWVRVNLSWMSLPAGDPNTTFKIRMISHEAQHDQTVSEKVVHWKAMLREKGALGGEGGLCAHVCRPYFCGAKQGGATTATCVQALGAVGGVALCAGHRCRCLLGRWRHVACTLWAAQYLQL